MSKNGEGRGRGAPWVRKAKNQVVNFGPLIRWWFTYKVNTSMSQNDRILPHRAGRGKQRCRLPEPNAILNLIDEENDKKKLEKGARIRK